MASGSRPAEPAGRPAAAAPSSQPPTPAGRSARNVALGIISAGSNPAGSVRAAAKRQHRAPQRATSLEPSGELTIRGPGAGTGYPCYPPGYPGTAGQTRPA
jgi:hypothetical protein